MKLTSNEKFYVVGKNEYVIKSGSRAGEVVNRITISNGSDLLRDVNVSDSLKVDNLILFTQTYTAVFDYSERMFSDRSYKTFSVTSLEPCK